MKIEKRSKWLIYSFFSYILRFLINIQKRDDQGRVVVNKRDD